MVGICPGVFGTGVFGTGVFGTGVFVLIPLDTVVISGEDVCCSVVFGTLVGVSVFSVI